MPRPCRPLTPRHAVRPAARALLALLLCVGCGGENRAPTAPPPDPPLGIAAVHPAPRSGFVDYTTDIWAEFDQPLAPASVNGLNVYLKIDTRRLPVAVSWDSVTRRIHVRPTGTLALLTTYTVELSPNLETLDGRRLGETYLWQFTTQSVRHPASPFPANRSMDSPFVTLSWGGNEGTAGTLIYELYVGADSSQVATRALPFVYRGGSGIYTPRTRWGEGTANWWSVTVENLDHGERYHGAVWRFDTPAADAPQDSTTLFSSDHAYHRQVGFQSPVCGGADLMTGPLYRTYQIWSLNLPIAPAWFSGVRWQMTSYPASQESLGTPVTIWAALGFPTCTFRINGTPNDALGPIATATRTGPGTIVFESDFLTAYLESIARRGGIPAFFLRSDATLRFVSSLGGGADQSFLRIFYRRPPEPAATHATARVLRPRAR